MYSSIIRFMQRGARPHRFPRALKGREPLEDHFPVRSVPQGPAVARDGALVRRQGLAAPGAEASLEPQVALSFSL